MEDQPNMADGEMVGGGSGEDLSAIFAITKQTSCVAMLLGFRTK